MHWWQKKHEAQSSIQGCLVPGTRTGLGFSSVTGKFWHFFPWEIAKYPCHWVYKYRWGNFWPKLETKLTKECLLFLFCLLVIVCCFLKTHILRDIKGGCAYFNMHIFTFNWLTVTSEMHFVKFHPEVASCLLSRGKRKYAPLGMRLLWKYIRNYFLVYQLISHFLLYLQNYKEF